MCIHTCVEGTRPDNTSNAYSISPITRRREGSLSRCNQKKNQAHQSQPRIGAANSDSLIIFIVILLFFFMSCELDATDQVSGILLKRHGSLINKFGRSCRCQGKRSILRAAVHKSSCQSLRIIYRPIGQTTDEPFEYRLTKLREP